MTQVPEGDPWARPPGVSDDTVSACGTLTEAFERLERARGHLYDFHQLMGRADELFGDAADALAASGHAEMAALVRSEVVGRNALDGRWSFQIVEEFDDAYYRPVGAVEQRVRDALVGGRRHIYEAEMKEDRRTEGHPAHTSRPSAPG